MNLPTRKEWEDFGFTVPEELCQPEPEESGASNQQRIVLLKLIHNFREHERYCAVCRSGQRLCEMGKAMMTGIGKAAIKESK